MTKDEELFDSTKSLCSGDFQCLSDKELGAAKEREQLEFEEAMNKSLQVLHLEEEQLQREEAEFEEAVRISLQMSQQEEENMERQMRMALDASLMESSSSSANEPRLLAPKKHREEINDDEEGKLQALRENIRRQRRERQLEKERRALLEAEEMAVLEAIQLSMQQCQE
eukprot:CAMPEP_0168752284 /NCGR_PEP_ID=MMETSP0724-20121128/18303_1 /TAXON_ID=265536 /ORGANISM="Amphiprora sp., Strain CCMP467" /LENGTH=168 /DNA_ID=CAMNT_0008800521 /DNA_START=55 /DNA_END=561 /DNA_ORIENTATION=-